MAVKVELAIKEGWKATQNERFGEVLEVRFIDNIDGKILFRYAPKLEDEVIWADIFKALRTYDVKLTELKTIINLIDKREYSLCGKC